MILPSINTEKNLNSIAAGDLSKLWKVTLKQASIILNSTTSVSRQIQEGQMTKRYRTDTYQKRYKRLGGEFSRFYTDTLFFENKTLQGNICAQIFVNWSGYTKLYPLNSKSKAHEALSVYIYEVVIP